ncbi:MAG: hypothetical protein RRZ93_06965 [Ruthenibacterium sp.]
MGIPLTQKYQFVDSFTVSHRRSNHFVRFGGRAAQISMEIANYATFPVIPLTLFPALLILYDEVVYAIPHSAWGGLAQSVFSSDRAKAGTGGSRRPAGHFLRMSESSAFAEATGSKNNATGLRRRRQA